MQHSCVGRCLSYNSSHIVSGRSDWPNAKFLLTLTYRKGHQGSNPGGHSFVFLNVSINKKPVFFS